MVNPDPLATDPPKIFSPQRVQLSWDRAQSTVKESHFLYNRVVDNLQERILDIKRSFQSPLFIGNRSGADLKDLAHTLKSSSPAKSLNFALGETTLPFPPHSFDLILNPLTLHWVNDIPGVLTQMKFCLKPDGVLLGALLGGETLSELKYCLLQAEAELSNKATLRVAPMVSHPMMGALLQRSGFALPVADIDRIQATYGSLQDLLHDLRRMGETSKMLNSSPLTRKLLEKAEHLYWTHFSKSNKLIASFEIIYFTGWSPHSSQQKPLPRGSGQISLVDELKGNPV